METAFLALVNYGTAGLLLVYNVQAFLCMRKKEQGRKKTTAIAMKTEIAAIFALCFFTLYLRTGEARYLLLFGVQLVTYGVIDYVYKRLYPKMSGLLFDHMRYCMLASGKNRSKVCIYDAVPIVNGHVGEQTYIRNTCVVHEHIDTSEAVFDVGE